MEDFVAGTARSEMTPSDWQAWQDSWDRQQEWYMPDREERFRVMLDMVEALVGTAPRVLDLACGTGSITDRLLKRFPESTSTGVDLDPALLTIARGHFADDPRVSFVTADLKDPDWRAALPHDSYDAVLTATALHAAAYAGAKDADHSAARSLITLCYDKRTPSNDSQVAGSRQVPDLPGGREDRRRTDASTVKPAGAIQEGVSRLQPGESSKASTRTAIPHEGQVSPDPARSGLRGCPYGLALPSDTLVLGLKQETQEGRYGKP
ncbi:class I SAM-dependent methyltransferase, partial [Streptomyces sp. NPDC059431]|uniref:class I SAM-dependent methyltransferase n=1 Tax=Streptomyces sp. NPDC059431 TaxID=3346828 RepID=UPI0036C816BF